MLRAGLDLHGGDGYAERVAEAHRRTKKIGLAVGLAVVLVLGGLLVWEGLYRSSLTKTGLGVALKRAGLSGQGRVMITNRDGRYEVYGLNEALMQEYLERLGVWERGGARGGNRQGESEFVNAGYVELLFANTPQGNEMESNGVVVATQENLSNGDGITIRLYFGEEKIAEDTFEKLVNVEILKAIFLVGSDTRAEGIERFNRELVEFVGAGGQLVSVRKAGEL